MIPWRKKPVDQISDSGRAPDRTTRTTPAGIGTPRCIAAIGGDHEINTLFHRCVFFPAAQTPYPSCRANPEERIHLPSFSTRLFSGSLPGELFAATKLILWRLIVGTVGRPSLLRMLGLSGAKSRAVPGPPLLRPARLPRRLLGCGALTASNAGVGWSAPRCKLSAAPSGQQALEIAPPGSRCLRPLLATPSCARSSRTSLETASCPTCCRRPHP